MSEYRKAEHIPMNAIYHVFWSNFRKLVWFNGNTILHCFDSLSTDVFIYILISRNVIIPFMPHFHVSKGALFYLVLLCSPFPWTLSSRFLLNKLFSTTIFIFADITLLKDIELKFCYGVKSMHKVSITSRISFLLSWIFQSKQTVFNNYVHG